ncbi:uncharacterized protein LOC127860437 isoform X2 [Dreissena polymorpha]|uniref:uncharacterized protein LOC127860437 isoform X2 n=1 Tax=Dreissena polymorpha TaxID=45954 RepID=UPI0022641C02|nr:uncharacterized protein LOC127860437 isoform X2 [Dreissena polymorpha]
MATTRDKVPSSEHEHTGENYQDTPAGMDIDREIDRTDSVSQPKDEQCPDCLKLTDERDQAELSLKFWKQEARNWKEDAKYWKQKYDTWHEQIAETMAKSSVMEKTSDMTSNTKVADMFDVTVKEMWVNLCEDLQDNNKSEIHRITNLSELMQAIYKECTKKVDADTKKLRECSFSINDMVPDEIALAVRMVRKQMCQNESQTTQVIEERYYQVRGAW